MLSIQGPLSAKRALRYFYENEAYRDLNNPRAVWLGLGAQKLGLTGPVTAEVFENLAEGFSPDRTEKLALNAEREDRAACWDLCFSAPKSFSIIWGVAAPELQAKLEDIHNRAVRAAIDHLENHYALARSHKDGVKPSDAGFIFAALTEHSNRADEPQLHSHVQMLNLAIWADGKASSIFTRDIYRAKMAVGALYRTELSALLQAELGFSVREHGKSFEIVGINQKLIDRFSTRRAEIKQALKEHDATSSRAAEIAALSTRKKKSYKSRAKLAAEWASIGKEYGFGAAQAEAMVGRNSRHIDPISITANLVDAAVEKLSRYQSTFSERDVLRLVAEGGQLVGLTAHQVVIGTKARLKSPEVVPLGNWQREPIYTTAANQKLETNLMEQISAGTNKSRHVLPFGALKPVLQPALADRLTGKHKPLSQEQFEALRSITTRSGSVQVLTARKGAEREAVLQAATAAWKRHGFKVIGASYSAHSAAKLKEACKIDASVVSKLIADLNVWPGNIAVGRKLIAPEAGIYSPLHGRSLPVLYERKNPVRLRSKSVLIIDEAERLNTSEMAALIKAAAKADAKIVLISSPGSLQPVGPGGAFRAIAAKLGAAKIAPKVSPTDSLGKRALDLLTGANADKALTFMRKHDMLHVGDTFALAKQELLGDWKIHGLKKPKENLIIAGAKADVTNLNREAQAARKAAGKLGLLSVRINEQRFRKGDRIFLGKRARRLELEAGVLGTIFKLNRKFFHVKLDDGRKIAIPLKHYDTEKLHLGYAVAVNQAPEMTTKRVFALVDPVLQDLHATTVQLSAATESTRLYADKDAAGKNLRDLSHSMGRDRSKDLAETMHDAIRQDQQREEELRRQKPRPSHSV